MMYGPKGWTVPVKKALAHCIDSETEGGDHCRFTAPAEVLKALSLQFPPEALTNRPGGDGGPQLSTVLAAEGVVTVVGYIIGPGRADERVTVQAAYFSTAETALEWAAGAEHAGDAVDGAFFVAWD